ncbi:hypothetical protein IAT38_003479 [Cryptococcus sp. DSM 104549]
MPNPLAATYPAPATPTLTLTSLPLPPELVSRVFYWLKRLPSKPLFARLLRLDRATHAELEPYQAWLYADVVLHRSNAESFFASLADGDDASRYCYERERGTEEYQAAQRRLVDAVLALRALLIDEDEPRTELPEGHARLRKAALLSRTRKLTLLDEVAVLRTLEALRFYAMALTPSGCFIDHVGEKGSQRRWEVDLLIIGEEVTGRVALFGDVWLAMVRQLLSQQTPGFGGVSQQPPGFDG